MVQFFIILDMQWSEMAVNVEYLKLHHHFSIVLDDEFGNFIGPLGILNEFKLSWYFWINNIVLFTALKFPVIKKFEWFMNGNFNGNSSTKKFLYGESIGNVIENSLHN